MHNSENYVNKIAWKLRANIITPLASIVQKHITGEIFNVLNIKEQNRIEELGSIFNGKRIAIVGNSPILGNSGKGSEIDEYDIIIRFNQGILSSELDGKNTGIHTTIWSTGALDTLFSKKIKDEIKKMNDKIKILVPYSFEGTKDKGVNKYFLEKVLPYSELNKYYIPQNRYLTTINKVGKEPTSGFSVIDYIINETNFGEIGIYGFSFSSENRIHGNSYAKQHDFSKENTLVLEILNGKSNVKLYE